MRVACWTAGLLLTGMVVPLPASVVAAGADLFRRVDRQVAFSPDGNGRRDVGRLHFRLTTGAEVTATFRRWSRVVRTMRWGNLDRGDHVIRWDGRTSHGRRLPDGRYTIVLTGLTRSGTRDVVRTHADVDTANCGRLVTTRPTVYPRATKVDDTVAVTFVECGWIAAAVARGDIRQAWTRLRVVNKAGKTIREELVRDQITPTIAWDGRRDDGFPAYQGDYQARVTTMDPAGNLRRRATSVRVSSRELRSQYLSYSVPAAEAATYVPWATKNAPDDCSPRPSARFEGGLSFGPCNSRSGITREFFAARAPVPRLGPADLFTVVAYGGPTTPGATDVAKMDIGPEGMAGCPPYEGWCYGSWSPAVLDGAPYLPAHQTPVFWSVFTTWPNSYDVKSFEIACLCWVPEP